ncbi:hypothetical protein AYI69_g9063 [Smittium culicis]|uniref:Uncharacterized protein n=1 Tax=Smittium culicis TaxID=133412 RepID=A0A1R1XFA0_9FUNG|nr:hypothetical protein AYI69_g9063 [Smittium culicis]
MSEHGTKCNHQPISIDVHKNQSRALSYEYVFDYITTPRVDLLEFFDIGGDDEATLFAKKIQKILRLRGRAHGRERGTHTDALSSPVQEEYDPGGKQGHNQGSTGSSIQGSHRKGESEIPRILQEPLYDLEEGGLNGFPGPRERRYVCSGPSDMQKISEARMEHAHVPILSSPLGLSLRLHNFTKVLKLVLTWESPKKVFGEHRKSIFRVYQSGIQNQLGKVDHGTIPINNPLSDGNKRSRYVSKSTLR